jgi:predicted signal transduction protein with EAL and GGDEF domain
VLARLGGDEFGIIVEGATDRGLDDFCNLILRVCAQTRRVSGHEVQVTASIGVAHQDSSAIDMVLMRHADLALYVAKRAGRNRHRLFDAAIDKAAKHRSSIEAGLERALHSNQFKMVYQPIVKAENGEILGFEALIRWDSPEHGAISPAEFVPIAEELGLIGEIGAWVLREACATAASWLRRGEPMRVCVNLSPCQLADPGLATLVAETLAAVSLPASLLELELTETALMEQRDEGAERLCELRALGVRISLDDFGTGYSSLARLQRLPLDALKIDRSFVAEIGVATGTEFVRSIIELAHTLGLQVIAEGVETPEQLEALHELGSDQMQGYLLGRPARDPASLAPAQQEVA